MYPFPATILIPALHEGRRVSRLGLRVSILLSIAPAQFSSFWRRALAQLNCDTSRSVERPEVGGFAALQRPYTKG